MPFFKSRATSGNTEESDPNKSNDVDSVQPDCSALEHTINRMETTVNDGERSGLCPDPRHHHSFRTLPFIMLPLYTCSGCGEGLQTYVVGGMSSSRAAVQCIACGVYAHRRCAFSNQTKWESMCPSAKYEEEYVFEDAGTVCKNVETITSGNSDDDKNELAMGLTQSMVTNQEAPGKMLEIEERSVSPEPMENNIRQKPTDQDTLNSIFRGRSTSSAVSIECRKTPVINASASVDGALTNRTTQNDLKFTKANFPFLSSASLLSSHNTSARTKSQIPAIRKCQTWDGYAESSSINSTECEDNLTKEQASLNSKTEIPEDGSVDDTDPSTNLSTVDNTGKTTTPLHFASHGFRVVSHALQENIMANFSRLIPRENNDTLTNKPGFTDEGDKLDDSSSAVDSELVEVRKSEDDVDEKKDDQQARSLLEVSKPQNDSSMDRKRIGFATVAGTIVGGVVGVGLAGPVGGVIGVKCGQTAGMLGLLLEGSVTASVLASGISVGMAAGQHIQEKHETRVLALGEGTKQRVLLMVRPTIQAPEPIWDEIFQHAKRSYTGCSDGIVNRLIPNESRVAKRERYEREVDIVETGEDELAIADKVLLLASRILSNKDSLPGHVYRKLIEAFRSRCCDFNLRDLQLQKQKEQKIEDSSITDFSSSENLSTSINFENTGQDEAKEDQLSHTHQRRRDAHAVIKYVTTSLLLTRPGFGYSPSLTEKTATAVESLVFGEIYDLVMEEIEIEYQNKDDLLLEKIANFERKLAQGDDLLKASDDDLCFGYKSCISEAALEALHCLTHAHSAVDKLRYCVLFLEQISEKYSKSLMKSAMGADSLLKMVCQHILLAKVIGINAQIAFLEEFARDEQLLRGREGYALVTLQASLHFLNVSQDFEADIFSPDDD